MNIYLVLNTSTRAFPHNGEPYFIKAQCAGVQGTHFCIQSWKQEKLEIPVIQRENIIIAKTLRKRVKEKDIRS